MRVAFIAQEGSFDADEYALVCALAGDKDSLTFQRDAEESAEDWGIQLEYNDQANGGYACVAACRVSPEMLSVDLSRQLGRLTGITGFDVTLRLSEVEAVRAGLRRVFRDHLNLLAEA